MAKTRFKLTVSNSLSPGKVIGTVVGLVTVVAFVVVIYMQSKPAEPMKPSAKLNTPVDGLPGAAGAARPAPELVTQRLDGMPMRLSDYRGKVLVVDFWATWCGPCRKEIPILKQLAAEHRSRGLEVVGLTIEDPAREGETVRRFVEQMQIDYPVGYATSDLFTTYIGPGQQPIPQTLIFGRDGRLQRHLIGFSPESDAPLLRETISRLLQESAS